MSATQLRCTFCGAMEEEREILIQGSDVETSITVLQRSGPKNRKRKKVVVPFTVQIVICDQCVRVCRIVIAEHKRQSKDRGHAEK